ncbi:MAG: DNA-binding MarR family transcriptional regulator [Neolewinella sp.]
MNSLSFDNVGTLLDRTTRLMKAHFQRTFKDAGIDITPEQWVLLDHLFKAGASSQTDLANGTFKDAPTVSRIIDKLSQKGMAQRSRFPNDRRRYQVDLTDKGREIHGVLNPKVEELRVQAWSGLSQDDYDDLVRLLGAIRENFPE